MLESFFKILREKPLDTLLSEVWLLENLFVESMNWIPCFLQPFISKLSCL